MSNIAKLEKAKKYFKAVNEGLTKMQALDKAGYATTTRNTQAIENTKAFKEVEESFKQVILKKWSKEDIVNFLKRNAEQDKDKGASNNALKLLMDRIEPQDQPKEVNNKVLMVFN